MIELKDSNGEDNFVQEGESANITATFDFGGTQFNKAGIITLLFTLYEPKSNTVLNNRDEQNVKDLNGGHLATDGVLTLELDAADNVIVDADGQLESGQAEQHIARLKWTWNDGDSVRTGLEELSFYVEKLAVPTNG